jgi:hypothetical protein
MYDCDPWYDERIRPNLQLNQVIETMLDERERMQRVELKGWWGICAFLLLMNIGALRLCFSLIGG